MDRGPHIHYQYVMFVCKYCNIVIFTCSCVESVRNFTFLLNLTW